MGKITIPYSGIIVWIKSHVWNHWIKSHVCLKYYKLKKKNNSRDHLLSNEDVLGTKYFACISWFNPHSNLIDKSIPLFTD